MYCAILVFCVVIDVCSFCWCVFCICV